MKKLIIDQDFVFLCLNYQYVIIKEIIAELILRIKNMAKEFTDSNFNNEVIEASKQKPVLVDFFANWCNPCKMQGPIVEEIAKEMENKAIVGKVDTEKEQAIASQYGISGIPTLMIFKDGKMVENFVGLQSKEGLIEAINKYL